MNRQSIYVIYGNDGKRMVKELLHAVKIENEITGDMLIGLKPNMVVAKPPESGATTSTDMVCGIIEYLKDCGFNRIIILEGSWVGDSTQRAFKVCGYDRISREYGVELFDTKKDGFKAYDAGGMKINVCDKVMEVDYLINLPVLKGHCQTEITCALKNMKGCIPDSEKRRFHTMGLHRPIAYLNKIVKPSFNIVDGLIGDLDFEEGGNPVEMNRIIAGKDPVLIDAYAAELMGYDPYDIGYIKLAEELGIGCADLKKAEIVELNKDTAVQKKFTDAGRKVKRLSQWIIEQDACSACYGSLVHALARLDEQGLLGRLREKVYIGQGFKGKAIEGIGVGKCTGGFSRCVKGCPPKAKDILEFLKEYVNA
ncbi:DUF362 domain-containing protein [Caldanaerobius polysaccharolyticus]|uniref:DUF362 domain-containing protein n=1 Tax=Caldanaerobius polysaccharolyticus TaxID=44256 RepID=UPI00047C6EFF|nr:DUF362 domain-containing protein [Caldanaerobius polysaccharolyticus]